MTEEIEEIRRQKLEELRSRDETRETDESGFQTSSDPIAVDGATELTEVVDEHGVVLVDFYADWCGPCQMLEPVVEAIAADTDATVAKVDIDANRELATEYSVRGVPTLLLFAAGQPVERLVGMQNEAKLRSVVEQYV